MNPQPNKVAKCKVPTQVDRMQVANNQVFKWVGMREQIHQLRINLTYCWFCISGNSVSSIWSGEGKRKIKIL